MKIVSVLVAFFALFCTANANAQAKKDKVKVYGNCEMCQSKIEKAAKAAGATTATWDVDSKVLAVNYSEKKTSLSKIEKAVAEAGYDTEHEVSTTEAYNKLPGCCQYDRKSADKKEEKKD